MAKDFKGNRVWRDDRPTPDKLGRLGLIDIEITDASGTRSYDRNGVVAAFAEGLAREIVPVSDLVSVCSGEPAAIYRTNEAEIALTGEEMFRLVFRSLSPDEFGRICDAVGATFELSDSFYDPRTGDAHDPRPGGFGIGPGGPLH